MKKNLKICKDQHYVVGVGKGGDKEEDRWFYLVTNASLFKVLSGDVIIFLLIDLKDN